MQIVIDIPEWLYKELKYMGQHGVVRYRDGFFRAIFNGNKLPKGHGRLIDADKLKSMYSINRANFNTVVGIQKWIDDAPTIIEADTESEE